MKLALPLLCAAMLSGCGTLVNRANPSADLSSDIYQCSSEANREYPPLYGTRVVAGSNQTSCYMVGNSMQCGGTSQPAQVVSDGIDQNTWPRLAAQQNCIAAKGWRRE